METKLEKQRAACDTAVEFTTNAYTSEIQLNVAVKPWQPRYSPPTPLLSLQPRPEHPITPSLPQQVMKNPPQELPTGRHTTPLLPPATLPCQVWSSRFAPCTQGTACSSWETEGTHFCLLQLVRAHHNCTKWPWTFLISTAQKRWLKLSFLYFTLMTAKEHTPVVSTIFSYRWKNLCFSSFDLKSLELTFHFLVRSTHHYTAHQLEGQKIYSVLEWLSSPEH